MRTFIRLCVAACLLLVPAAASAVYSCSMSTSGFATAYFPAAGTTNITQTSFTLTCTRALTDATTMSYSARADNGMYANGTNNRANQGASYIKYDFYKDSACGTQWKGPSVFSGTLNFNGATSVSITTSYWGCVAAGQNVPAGTYTDTETFTVTYGPLNTTTTATAGVSISTPATCNVTTPPGNIVFNYTSLGPAVNANTSYGVTCTNALPYTMALDATTGTLVGITYTLALSAASATGTGLQQLHTIDGTAAAGQSGICAGATCTASQPRTLTISY